MRIGYFGGSFDPPHRGHLAVARAARDRFHLDRILLAPTGRQPLKPNGPSVCFEDRLHMTELLCAGQPRLEASAIDAPHPDGSPNYTVDTLKRLREHASSEAAVFAVVGADAFLSLPQWRNASELLEIADWIVVSRPGVSLKSIDALASTAAQRSRVHLLEGVADPTSATDIRARLREHLPCEGFVPDQVLAYIRHHKLYEAQDSSPVVDAG